MRDDKLAVIQPVMADQFVDKFDDVSLEIIRFHFELFERLFESVCNTHISALEFLHQFDVVISSDTHASARVDHAHDDAQNIGCLWTPVHKVSHEDNSSPLGVSDQWQVVDMVC